MSLITNTNRKWWVLIGVSLANFLGCVDFTIVNTALPAIQSSLHASVDQLQWIINIFLLALCALMVIMGRLGDIHGRRKVLYMGMVAFGLSSLGAGLSTNIDMLIIFRLFQGISTAILYTVAGALVAHTFDKAERGKAMGIMFGVAGIGLAVGPVLGGILVGALSWRWVFLVNVPVIILSFAICIPSVQESKNTEHGSRIDWLGFVFLSLGLGSLILGMVKGDEWGWISATTIVTFAIAIASFITLYYVEKRTDSPIIKFELFTNRYFITSILATFSLGFFYCLAFFLMPLFLHNMQGYDGFKLGFMLLPTTAVMAILSPFVGRATDKYGPKPLLIIGFIFFVICAALQLGFHANSSVWFIALTFATMGVGWAAILGPASVAAISAVPDSATGVAMGSAWTLHNVGGVIGLALGTVVYHYLAKSVFPAARWADKVVSNPDSAIQTLTQHLHISASKATTLLQHSFMGGYHGAMVLLMVVSVIALLVIGLAMPKQKAAVHVDVNELGETDIHKI
tara:strand:- start:99928 stop:101466 length:1539 start_codon:yes stop_codon:yes gene_type:complete